MKVKYTILVIYHRWFHHITDICIFQKSPDEITLNKTPHLENHVTIMAPIPDVNVAKEEVYMASPKYRSSKHTNIF